eukprot:scaffold28188_cov66-Phaeocystis_antarctica.AAC.14
MPAHGREAAKLAAEKQVEPLSSKTSWLCQKTGTCFEAGEIFDPTTTGGDKTIYMSRELRASCPPLEVPPIFEVSDCVRR